MSILRYITLFTFISLANCIHSQVPSFKWANKVKDFSPLWNGPTDIKTDALGNVYVLGRFGNLNDFDPGPSVHNLIPNGTNLNSDIFILKLDSLGNFMWVKQIGGKGSEFGSNLVFDSAGNIYLAGQFSQTVDFDPGPATYTLSSVNWNTFILKLDMNGNFVYAKKVPGMGPYIALDVNNNVLVTGWFSGAGDFDPGPGVFNLYEAGSGDIFILKLNTNGNFMWAKAMGGSSADGGILIKSDALGNVFVAGDFEGTCSFGSVAGILTSLGEKDLFLLKLNSLGNFQWVKRLGGTSYDRIRSIEVDAANNLFAAGLFSVSCDMDPGPGTTIFTTPSISTFLLKLDNAGNHVWSKQLGDSTVNEPWDISLDIGGNVYTIGYFSGSGDFDPGPSTHILTAPLFDHRTFISKLDNAGNHLWVGSVGGSATTEGIAITVSNNQNVYITGLFYGTADFNPGILVDTLNWTGYEHNMFIAGYGKCMQPFAPAMSNPASNLKICSGGTTALAVAGTGTVNWYSSQYSNITIGTGNNYSTSQLTVNTTFYIDDNTMCAQSASRTALTVTVNPLPIINVNLSDSIVCVGESVTLTATGANSYTWGPNSNSPSFIVSPSMPYSLPYGYSVLGMDSNSCTNVGAALVYARLCSGIDESDLLVAKLKIYPAPCKGILNIETDDLGLGRTFEISITGALGQIAKHEKIIFDKTTAIIDASDLPPGVYYVSLSSVGSKTTNKKIIIVK